MRLVFYTEEVTSFCWGVCDRVYLVRWFSKMVSECGLRRFDFWSRNWPRSQEKTTTLLQKMRRPKRTEFLQQQRTLSRCISHDKIRISIALWEEEEESSSNSRDSLPRNKIK
jgi:hypothetical protein